MGFNMGRHKDPHLIQLMHDIRQNEMKERLKKKVHVEESKHKGALDNFFE